MSDIEMASGFGEFDGPGMPPHIYFHVPFCRSKCSYCDFNSFPVGDPQEAVAIFIAMESEVRQWGLAGLSGPVETVYVGGGTPSLFAPAVSSLLESIPRSLLLAHDAEITVEANPDSLTSVALESLVEGGATRISVGVQAFDDSVLRLLGRAHDARKARKALELVYDARLELSVDLICGVPGQTMASWAESLEEALDARAKHLSIYPLSVEEGTPLAAAISGGLVDEPDPDLAAEMMLLAKTRLAEAGILRYEVANYAAPGHEARHNTAYWLGEPYVGIGPGAHGMLGPDVARTMGIHRPPEGADVARVRYSNPGDPMGWLRGRPLEVETLTAEEAAREDVMLGMRLTAGVRAEQVDAAGLSDVLASLAADGLVELAEGRWRTTERGWLLGNEVFGRIWTDD